MLAGTQVKWVTCTGGRWCALRRLELRSVSAKSGVYIIWCDRLTPRAIRIGQGGSGRTGSLRARLSEHRNNREILRFDAKGLYVTWAEVRDAKVRKGVENYLGRVLVPLIGARFPCVPPVRVNLPWIVWHRPRGSQFPLGGELYGWLQGA